MSTLIVNPIGEIRHNDSGSVLVIDPAYRPALKALDGFGHINVLWWCDKFDSPEARSTLEVEAPYKKSPEVMGIFATRSPIRPNPIALTAVQIVGMNSEAGEIYLAYIDADDGTPVLDIKPYTPSIDRIEQPIVPQWCSHWPNSAEASGDFDWGAEFNF